MARPGLVLMGRVSGAFGVKGEIKVFPFGQDPDRLVRAGLIHVGPNPEATRTLTVRSWRLHAGRVLITAGEVSTREQAAALAGAWVYLLETALPPLEEGEYYWYQVKGARVVTQEGRHLGLVKDIAEIGARDLLLVMSPEGKEALVPVVEGVVLAIDAQAGQVIVDLPPGLLAAQGWPEEDQPEVVPPEGEPGHDL
jgi:16S rRNA processing protein RimM